MSRWRWLIGLLQILGPILGAWHFMRSVWEPYRAFRGGAFRGTWGGFYGPLGANFFVSLLGVGLVFLAPRWRSVLEWIRESLPCNEDEAAVGRLIELLRGAFTEKRENGELEARNLAAQLNGVTEREQASSKRGELLQQELQRILTGLRGGAGG